jgi:hypothetical protein
LTVVVKNPADFIGSALGQSESQTKGILASTVGKVLVIDEVCHFNLLLAGFRLIELMFRLTCFMGDRVLAAMAHLTPIKPLSLTLSLPRFKVFREKIDVFSCWYVIRFGFICHDMFTDVSMT